MPKTRDLSISANNANIVFESEDRLNSDAEDRLRVRDNDADRTWLDRSV